MSSLVLILLATTATPGDVVEAQSYLYQPAFCMDHLLRGPARPYHPQPGDIFLATDKGFFAKMGHRLGLTAAPHHSGLVVQRSDGRLGLLEGGPFNTFHCRIVDLEPHLAQYAEHERVWIRRRSIPLTCEQNRRLTAFAEAVDGKCFSIGKLLKQLTPLRHRGPVRTAFVGHARAADFEADGTRDGLKKSYYCSELVVEALVAACALDPETARPSATFPRDLFFGRSINPYIDRHLTLCEWDPPARWTACPGNEHPAKVRPWLDGDGPGPAARKGPRPGQCH
ncbi:MAG: hypothetical protein U0840_14920 [Gemmataceae bacterium]